MISLPSPRRALPHLALGLAFAATAAAADLIRTPELTEGPFYTLGPRNTLPAPVDQDHDLTRVGPDRVPATGTTFILAGTVVDLAGRPLADATVELWQTDHHGVYYHSNEPKSAERDPHFQSFGKALTSADGSFTFRTIKPGLYTGRVRHFHFRIKLGAQTVLTSQFVFADQRASFGEDNVTAGLAAASLATIVLDPQPGTAADGEPVLIARPQIVVDPTARSSAQPSPRGPGPGFGPRGPRR
jgi:protocatechuate 3,4-dioxygenase beta subunit